MYDFLDFFINFNSSCAQYVHEPKCTEYIPIYILVPIDNPRDVAGCITLVLYNFEYIDL
jgi:hypothetical protein